MTDRVGETLFLEASTSSSGDNVDPFGLDDCDKTVGEVINGIIEKLEEPCKIPLRDKKGNVLDYALVSPEDFERVSKHSWCRIKGTTNKTFYAQASINGVKTSLQEFIMGAKAPKGQKIDHKDLNGLHNAKPNLRYATNAQNGQNIAKREGLTSKFIGVSWHKSKSRWRVNIGKKEWTVQTEEEGARKYDEEAIRLYGIEARTNGTLTQEEKQHIVDNPVTPVLIVRDLPTGIVRKIWKSKTTFQAFISVNNKNVYLGSHETVEEAVQARETKRRQLIKEKFDAHMRRPIDRNADGVAVLKLHNRQKEVVGEALVDDDDWRQLSLVSWSLSPQGYAQGTINGTQLQLQQYLVTAGEGNKVDHRNHNTLDHRRANLRVTDAAGNSQNRRKRSGMTSVYIGVSKHGNKWHAQIAKNNETYNLGNFDHEIEAARAYNKKAIDLYDQPILNALEDLQIV